MNYKVHRWRFCDWKPAAVRSLACDPFSDCMALGREDGTIEIKTAMEKWCTLAHVAGRTDFSLRGLVWSTIEAEKGRLFGISLRGFVFEVCLSSLSIVKVTDCYGGAAWCLAINPGRSVEVAVGCEDGSVRIFRYADGSLAYKKALPNTGSRVLSLAYHPKRPLMFLGGADGVIRCVNEQNGRAMFRMTGDLVRGSQTMIRSLLVLSDSTVVSGDNRGRLQIWDGHSGVLMLNIHQHTADVMAIAASEDENTLFASGVDSKVICVRRIPREMPMGDEQLRQTSSSRSSSSAHVSKRKQASAEPMPYDSSWVYTDSKRPHTHDVMALAVCTATLYPPQPQAASTPNLRSSETTLSSTSSNRSDGSSSSKGKRARARTNSTDGTTYVARRYQCLISGGVDTKLCTYSVDDFQRARPVWQIPSPSRAMVNASADGSVVSVQKSDKIDLWRLRCGSNAIGDGRSCLDEKTPCVLALRLLMSGEANIQCSALSDDCSYLAVSSASGVQVWAVEETPGSAALSIKDIDVSAALGKSRALVLQFSAVRDNTVQLAVATTSGEIRLVDLRRLSNEESASLEEKDDGGEEEEEEEDEEEEDGNSDEDSSNSSSTTNDSDMKDVEGHEEDDEDDGEEVADKHEPPRYSKCHQVRLVHIYDHADLLRGRLPDVESAPDGGARCRLLVAVSAMTFSADGVLLAVASVGCRVSIYDLDQRRLVWVAPPVSAPVTALNFHPSSPTLVVLMASNEFTSYDVEKLQITAWSKENTALIPRDVKALPRPLEGIAFDPNDPAIFFIFGQGLSVVVNMSSGIPLEPAVIGANVLMSHTTGSSDLESPRKYSTPRSKPPLCAKKPSKDSSLSAAAKSKSRNFALITSYRSMIYMQCLKDGNLSVIENPWIRILEQLPDTLERKQYGA